MSPTDTTYVYYGAASQFTYYTGLLNMDNVMHVDGTYARNDHALLDEDMDSFPEMARIWILLDHVAGNEDEILLNSARKRGRIINCYRSGESSVHLLVTSDSNHSDQMD